jgi:hypothetical protein
MFNNLLTGASSYPLMFERRILVTGGSGFLGSHLCDRLVARGDDVVCADNLFTGRKRNVAHLLNQPNFEFLRHDVTFPLYVEVDQIYNLACPARPALPAQPDQDDQDVRHGRHQHAWASQTREGAGLPSVEHERSVRRSRTFTRSRKNTGARQSDRHSLLLRRRQALAPRRSSSTTTAKTRSISALRGSSTPTARACIQTTAASSQTLSSRPYAARTSRSMAMAPRRARSATSTI